MKHLLLIQFECAHCARAAWRRRRPRHRPAGPQPSNAISGCGAPPTLLHANFVPTAAQMAISHTVLLKTASEESDVLRVFEELRALIKVVPGLLSFDGGKYTSPEGFNRGYTWGFNMMFTDAAARDAYLTHPAHVAAAQSVIAICEGGINGVLAFDFAK